MFEDATAHFLREVNTIQCIDCGMQCKCTIGQHMLYKLIDCEE